MNFLVKKISEKRNFEAVTYLHSSIQVIKIKMYFNAYFYKGLVIDTGPTTMAFELKQFYNELPVEQLAVTHIHEDHCGLAKWLQEERGVRVFVPENSIADCLTATNIPYYRKLVWGDREAFNPDALPGNLKVQNENFQVIKSSGHIEDHVVFLNREKGWLFTGDLFVSVKQNLAFKGENITQEIETLKKLSELDFEFLFCPHSGIHKGGKALLRKKYDYFVNLKGKIEELRNKGVSEDEMERKLFNRFHPFKLVSKGEWSAKNIIRTI